MALRAAWRKSATVWRTSSVVSARRGHVLHPGRGEHLPARGNRGGCYGLTMMRRIVGVRHTPGVHDLDEDTATLVVHGGGHLLPACDMRWAVDAGRRKVAL